MKKKLFSFASVFAMGATLFLFNTGQSVADTSNHRIFYEDDDVIGCYMPGQGCYSSEPWEDDKIG